MKPREERLRYWRDVALASASCGGRIYKGWQSVFFFFLKKEETFVVFSNERRDEMRR
jgi:hypothetical protein